MYSTVTTVIRRLYACGEDEWLSTRAFEHENNKAVTGIGERVGENAGRGQAVGLTRGYRTAVWSGRQSGDERRNGRARTVRLWPRGVGAASEVKGEACGRAWVGAGRPVCCQTVWRRWASDRRESWAGVCDRQDKRSQEMRLCYTEPRATHCRKGGAHCLRTLMMYLVSPALAAAPAKRDSACSAADLQASAAASKRRRPPTRPYKRLCPTRDCACEIHPQHRSPRPRLSHAEHTNHTIPYLRHTLPTTPTQITKHPLPLAREQPMPAGYTSHRPMFALT